MSVGDVVTMEVDYVRREDLKKGHTSTHMLNLALLKVLQVKSLKQMGSKVSQGSYLCFGAR